MEDYTIRVPQAGINGYSSDDILIVIPRITHIFVYDKYQDRLPTLLVNMGNDNNIRLSFEDIQERDLIYVLIITSLNTYYDSIKKG